ncbi:ubiquitin-related modifier 1 [Lineolata rhizophorae]|uniref:Ubiquitin-related modifier 1 n=1 Tax=Lineolata rhizophorae TaxID=578093 RepID=A0A6A6PE60_9PEZI|nr:ubiquitin-related modifier 1 [Lineolata rhizophorae]
MAEKTKTNKEDFIPLTVEFSGGLEMLFSNQKKHDVSIPARDESGNSSNIAFLVRYLCDNLMKDPKKEFFIQDNTVRPGILVLINDADWQLEGEDEYEVKKGDNILFVSTLHGG